MWVKIVIFIMLAIIIYCLGSGLVYLIREGRDSRSMARALTWRIILSLLLFAFLLVAFFLGWFVPHPSITM